MKSKDRKDFSDNAGYEKELKSAYDRMDSILKEFDNSYFLFNQVKNHDNIVGLSNFNLPIKSALKPDMNCAVVWIFDS